MTTRYLQWSGGVFVDKGATPELSKRPGTQSVLPRFRVHIRVFRELSIQIPSATDGDVIGSLSGRFLDAGAPDHPSTLFVDTLVPSVVPSFGQGLGRVFVPVIKCQDIAVPEALRSGRLKWRRLNARGVANAPGTTVLRMLHTVALCSLTGPQGVSGISLVLTVELPRFNLWQVPVDRGDGTGPLISDVSLAIALAGGTPVVEGEDIGFLARPLDGHNSSRIVEPVHLTKADGRDVVGVWVLGGEERGRLATALYVSRSQSKRNLRLNRSNNRRRSSAERRDPEIGFLLAHYSKERGGQPVLFQCQAVLEAQEETYVASITDDSGDEFADTFFADFRAASSIAREQSDVLRNHGEAFPGGNLERLAGQVNELRTALDARVPKEPDAAVERSIALAGIPEGTQVLGESQPVPLASTTSGAIEAPRSMVLSNLPRALEVEFRADDLDYSDDADFNRPESDEENWERIESLAEKYLGPDYATESTH